MPTVRDIARFLEAWAPPASAQSYDNVGLQVGDPSASVERAILALDLTPAVVDEAEEIGAGLVVTHHPLLFRPLKRVTMGDPHGELVLRLARAGVALYTAHTNLDAARGGVSFALAERLGLREIDFLAPAEDTRLKLVAFVPSDHLDGVRAALAEAGAGRIGAYEACAFAVRGTGFFRPTDAADPFVGRPGEDETVDEWRLEVEMDRWALPAALAALRAAHPYEEVAYDVYPVQQASRDLGMGAVGRLDAPLGLADFLAHVADRLEADTLRYVGADGARIETVAVCGGAGRDLVGAAVRAGADAYVTADVGYHNFFDALDAAGAPRLVYVDAGHYETEFVTEALLQERLAARFDDVEWRRTRHRTSPIRGFARR